MAKDIVEIRERRYKLELFELKDNLELTEKDDSLEKPAAKEEPKALCELVSFSARFALNDIPAATVVPAIGMEIIRNGDKLLYEKLQELAINSKPVGVYLTIIHSTRSSKDGKDKQYWPDDRCCIFKGYLQPPTFEITAFNSGRSITIWHWLSALANISLLTTSCYIGNPIETSMQFHGLFAAHPEGVWHPVLSEKTSLSNIWNEGIKPLYTQLLDWGEDFKDKYNDFVKDQRTRIRTAISKINQEIEIQELLNGSDYLNRIIAADIQSDAMSDFIQTDGWSKLISDYCPSYLMAISPQVDQATLIPVPCTVDKEKAIPISLQETFSIQATPFIAKKISHMICVAAQSPNNNNNPAGTAHYVGLGTYPPKKVDRGGINVTIGFPSWITAEAVSAVPNSSEMLDYYMEAQEAIETVKTRDEEAAELRKLQRTIGQRYAQVAYLTQVFNSTFVRVAMPVNMTICPGAMVKVELSRDNEAAFYGTVASVEVNLTSGNTVLTTVLTITNVRDSVSIDDIIDNPQKDVGFFVKQWSGNGVNLYAK